MIAVQHDAGSRDRIISAARRLFSANGFHQTPMSELAAEAGVSVGLIYRFFTGKNDVILAIVTEDSDAKVAELADIVAEARNGLEIESAFARLTEIFLSKKNEALSFDILAEAHRNALVASKIDGFCTSLRSFLRELTEMAVIKWPEERLEAAEEMLLGLLFGLGHRGLSKPKLSVTQTSTYVAEFITAMFKLK